MHRQLLVLRREPAAIGKARSPTGHIAVIYDGQGTDARLLCRQTVRLKQAWTRDLS